MKRSLMFAAAVLAAAGPVGGHSATAPRPAGPSGRCIGLTQGLTDAAKAIALAQATPPGENPPPKRQLDRQAATMQRSLNSAAARYRAGGCGPLKGSTIPGDYLPAARRCLAETARETGEMEAKFNDQFKNLPHAAPDPPLDPSLCVQSNWSPEPVGANPAVRRAP